MTMLQFGDVDPLPTPRRPLQGGEGEFQATALVEEARDHLYWLFGSRAALILVAAALLFTTMAGWASEQPGGTKKKPTAVNQRTWQLSEFVILLGWPFLVFCPDDAAVIKAAAEADFNVIMWDVGKLPLCHRYGLKLMVDHASGFGIGWDGPDPDPQDEWDWRAGEYFRKIGPLRPEMASALSEDPAIWGYWIIDEPRSEQFPEMAAYLRAFEQADSGHPAYINLLWPGGEYLENFLQVVKPQVLSYDYYQWWWGREGHFPRLEEHRRAALAEGIPLLCWVEVNANPEAAAATYGQEDTVAHLPDNAVKLRQSVYTSLAYGVEGIEWFTAGYMFDFGTSKLNACGRDVAALNAELKRLGPVLVRLRSTDVFHTPPLPAETRALPADYWVQTETPELVLGVFKDRYDDAADYLLVANKGIQEKREVVLQFRRPVALVEQLDKQSGKWRALPLTTGGESQLVKLTLAPGDGELLRVVGP